ncbi:MAG: hypothetical protein ACREN1_02055 [Candidatus Dormibacteria bacterium]
MAESRLSGGTTPRRKAPRLRAGRRLRERHNFVGFHGHGLLALIFFAILALSVLGVGLGVASLTIFAVGGGNGSGNSGVVTRSSPSPSPAATAALVGHPLDGTIVGLWAAENLIAVQPSAGQPVQATITSKSTITRGGAASTIDDLIPGDAVVVTFKRGPKGTLVVVSLTDVETVPTNTPSGSISPLPNVTPTPVYTPNPQPQPQPTPNPSKGPIPAP